LVANETLLIIYAPLVHEYSQGWFTFVMCNPPFYESETEMTTATGIKVEKSHAAPTAAHNELITQGGEVEFVGRMIAESVTLGKEVL
jgi:methyltransferase